MLLAFSSHFLLPSLLSPQSSCFIAKFKFNLLSRSGRIVGSRRSFVPPPRSTFEKEEPPPPQQQQHSEFDREKVREALQKLDQQLQTLTEKEEAQLPKSTKPPSPYSDLNLDRDAITGMKSAEELPEISGSYLYYTAVALLLLTIFNNIIFNVFIKPSVDGYEQSSPIERVPLKEP